MTPARLFVAEFVGTALLLAAVVGSGIMGERLAGGNLAIALLANAIARDVRRANRDALDEDAQWPRAGVE